jgi:uncharacterized protein (TIGR02996 family)
MILTERDGIVADIIKNPDDDSLKMILADWYEDHGDMPMAAILRDGRAAHYIPVRDEPSGRVYGWRPDPDGEDLGDREFYTYEVPASLAKSNVFYGILAPQRLILRNQFVSGIECSLPAFHEIAANRRLARLYPIQEVKITGSMPVRCLDGEYVWHRVRNLHHPSDVNFGIDKFLTGEDGGSQIIYPDADSALADLNRAALLWARTR